MTFGMEHPPRADKIDELRRAKTVIGPLLEVLRVNQRWFDGRVNSTRSVPTIGKLLSQQLKVEPGIMNISIHAAEADAYVKFSAPIECPVHIYDDSSTSDSFSEIRQLAAGEDYNLSSFTLRLGRPGEHEIMMVSRQIFPYDYQIPDIDGHPHTHRSRRYSRVEVVKINPEEHDFGFRAQNPDGDIDIAIPGAPIRLKISDFFK